MPHYRSIYASFDQYPSTKGAGTHIREMIEVLFGSYRDGLLLVPGSQNLPSEEVGNGYVTRRCSLLAKNFLERMAEFSHFLKANVRPALNSLKVCHFRDPWSGIPLIELFDEEGGNRPRLVYEVNGLPSIELPYHYAALSSDTLSKIRRLEEVCWERADTIITPARAIRDNLVRFGCPEEKIVVIPNGAFPISEGVSLSLKRPVGAPDRYIIYLGTVQAWQGIEVLFRSLSLLRDLPNLALVMCCSVKEKCTNHLHKLASKLEIADRIIWNYQLSRDELNPWIRHAALSVAPLTECTRNIEQGCSPIKILESMALGVPVISTLIPSVEELITDGCEGLLVRPNRPSELAREIRIGLEYPDKLRELGKNGALKIRRHYSWEVARVSLGHIYTNLTEESPVSMPAEFKRIGAI